VFEDLTFGRTFKHSRQHIEGSHPANPPSIFLPTYPVHEFQGIAVTEDLQEFTISVQILTDRSHVRPECIAVARADVRQIHTGKKPDGIVRLQRGITKQSCHFVNVGSIRFPVFQRKRTEQRYNLRRWPGMGQEDCLEFDGVFFAMTVFPGQKVPWGSL